jgi:hypothetical protein
MIKLCQNNCGVEIEVLKNRKYCEECSKFKKKENMSKFIKKYLAKYYKENKENIAKRKAKWFQKNKERLREKGRARAREYRKKKLNSTNSTTII